MDQPSLYELLLTIHDPRAQDDRLKHKLIDILVLTVLGVTSSCDDFEDIHDFGERHEEWLRQHLELPNGLPSTDTIGRVVSLVSYKEVERVFSEWVTWWRKDHELKHREVIGIDGKFVNGARQKSYDSRSTLLMVSAYATETGICLGMERSYLKKEEGEKRATEQLIENLILKGTIVRLDANGASPRIIDAINKKEGDWLIGLKTNQKSLYKLAEFSFDRDIPPSSIYSTEETSHGRHEKRTYEQISFRDCDCPAMHQNFEKQKEKWPGLESFVRMTSERTLTQNGKTKTTQTKRYYFSSLKDDVREASHAIRKHWAIENNLHWTIDVVFREDYWQVRRKQAAENLAALRRLALNMLKQETNLKRSLKRKRRMCGWDPNYLEQVLRSQPAPH